jgi:pilus assembly protein CpaF
MEIGLDVFLMYNSSGNLIAIPGLKLQTQRREIGAIMSKKSMDMVSLDSVGEQERKTILRAIYDKADTEPPVGERYESLLREIIRSAIADSGVNLNREDTATLLEELFAYVASYGPITPYLEDPKISEVMVNGPDQVFIEIAGKMILTDTKFDNNEQVRFAINHMINPRGRFVNRKHPLVDSRLPDGSRMNATIAPVSPEWPTITIRRFLKDKLTIDQLVELGSLSPKIAEFLAMCVQARLNIVIAGNTSSGKTTFLNNVAQYIPDTERIVIVEDSAELNLHQVHKISLEAQPPDYMGEGAVPIRDLVKNCLRMRPDRIIVGEVRGGEAMDMLQAMNTGHDGSLTTVHSNSPRDTISRLETMALMAGIDVPLSAVRKQIASALNLIVYLSRMPDGSRRLTHVSEVVGMEGDVVTMTDLFVFQQAGLDENKKIKGFFKATGLRPSFARTFEAGGYHMDAKWFMN